VDPPRVDDTGRIQHDGASVGFGCARRAVLHLRTVTALGGLSSTVPCIRGVWAYLYPEIDVSKGALLARFVLLRVLRGGGDVVGGEWWGRRRRYYSCPHRPNHMRDEVLV
jgi:hypothetical protein